MHRINDIIAVDDLRTYRGKSKAVLYRVGSQPKIVDLGKRGDRLFQEAHSLLRASNLELTREGKFGVLSNKDIQTLPFNLFLPSGRAMYGNFLVVGASPSYLEGLTHKEAMFVASTRMTK